MATPDISRHATDFRKHWDDVRMQQGRVLTDDDFNESARLRAEDMRRTRLDVIGPAGSPDNGFLIKIPGTAGATFTISAGTFYLGGLRLTLEKDESFELQSDWVNQSPADRLGTPTVGRFDFVWIEAWEQPVSAVEDTELLEVALGGPDTSVRVQKMYRVHVLTDVGTNDCASAFDKVKAQLNGTLNAGLELVSDARLKVEMDTTAGTPDLCSPPVQGGYLGAENQAIRVQIVGAAGAAPGTPGTGFSWGFDNASPLYRVKLQAAPGATGPNLVTMLTTPKDQAHWPLAGQVVEILPWSALLPNGEKTAEISGHLTTVESNYDPDLKQFTILPPIPPSFGEDWKGRTDAGDLAKDDFFYLRVWNRGSDTTSPAAIPIVAGGVSLVNTGLKVTFTGTLRTGDFWVIAARPESPDVVVPWELTGPQGRAAHGIRRWFAPLGIIQWTTGSGTTFQGTLVDDCRPTFPPLTRLGGCCTCTVGDNVISHGHFSSIQEAIDHLPQPAGGKVCVLPGTFTENIVMKGLKNITVAGCGERSRIVSSAPPTGATSAGPVILVSGGQNIAIDSLAIFARETGFGMLLEGADPSFAARQPAALPLIGVTLSELFVTAARRSAVRVHHAREVVVRECHLQMEDSTCLHHALFVLGDDVLIERNLVEVPIRKESPLTGNAVPGANFQPGSFSRGGIQIGGTSERVRIIDNLIRGGAGNGITLGSLIFIDGKGDPVPPTDWPKDPPADPCDPKGPATVVIVVVAVPVGGGSVRAASAGTLREIVIERNRIYQMGMNGIGVAGFFDLGGADEFISIERLSILGNDIRWCLRRTLAAISDSMINSVGYGGISLADVEGLVIRDNLIADNGPSHVEPVCGVFVLHAEGMDVSRNRIVNNGAKTDAPAAQAKVGRRGGINVVFAVAPMTPVRVAQTTLPGQNGEPALKVMENVVSAPLGQALSMTALGPVAVADNQFTSRGIVQRGTGATFFAATVAILNLGLSNELYLQFLAFSAIAKGSLSTTGFATAPQVRPGLDDQRLGAFLANGNVLFADNQCVLDLFETGVTLSVSSVAIFSLDDIGFHGNQCDCNLADDIVLAHVVLFAFSLRASDNRLKESLLNALFSAVTFGFLNMTTNNQTTHCLLARAFVPAYLVNAANTVLIDPAGTGFCERFSAVQNNFGKTTIGG